jgi:hypothetical protein
MFRIVKWATPVVAFGLLMGLLHTRAVAEDNAAVDTGTVKGVVMGADDKPAAGVNIRIVKPMPKHAGDHHKPKEQAAGDKPAKADRPAPVATGKTDSDGKFTIENVPVGKFVVMANLKGVGVAHEMVEVKKGETADVSLKLAPREKKHKEGAAQ